MKEIENLTEWFYSNLDLIEECKEKNIKPIVLIGGASSSGKSYVSKLLSDFLKDKNYSSIVLSTDSYNNGISKNVFNIVNEKYYNNTLKNAENIVKNIKNIIIDTNFGEKFCSDNLEKIKKSCQEYFNKGFNFDVFLYQLEYEFKNINFDKKNIYNLDEVSSDLSKLSNDNNILEKSYSKRISERVETDKVINGKDFDVIIVEGIYALDDKVLKYLNKDSIISNFIECDTKNLFIRRVIRDSQITDCSNSFIIKNYLDYVAPEYINSVLPLKKNSNIILKNNLTFEELRQGDKTTQQKYIIDKKYLKEILKDSKLIKKCYQTDTYFGNENDSVVLRLREEGIDKNNLELESLTFKGMAKCRKDDKLIRPELELASKESLNDIFKNRIEAINKFKDANMYEYKTTKKLRYILEYKGQIINIDNYGDKIVLETNSKNSNINLKNRKEYIDEN